MKKWIDVRAKDEQINNLDNAYLDIWSNWQEILNELFALCEKLKVPGRKAKGKNRYKLIFHIQLMNKLWSELCSS